MSTNVTIENLGPCKKLLRFEVEPSKLDEAFALAAKEVQRQVRVPGFRPGKAPVERVVREYGEDIREEAKRQLINDSFRTAVAEHSLHPISYTEPEEIKFEKGEAFVFAIRIETAPEFELPEYRRLPIKRESREVTEADVENGLEALQRQGTTFEKADRPVQEGDVVVVNYRGTVDGKPITEIAPVAQGLSEKSNFWVEIKPDSFLPGFPEQLKGASAGDKKTVSVQFPPDFVPGDLAGRQGVYEVEVVEVKERRLPEMNDELAKKWGAGNLAELRAGVRRDLQAELNDNQRREVRGQAIRLLLDKVQFDLPESYVDQETRNVVYDIVSDNTRRGVPKETIEKEKEGIYAAAQQTARERVKAAYLFARIAEKEGIDVSQQEIMARVSMIAQNMKVAPQKLIQDMRKNKRLGELEQQMLHEKVISFLVEHASVQDLPAAPEGAPPAKQGS